MNFYIIQICIGLLCVCVTTAVDPWIVATYHKQLAARTAQSFLLKTSVLDSKMKCVFFCEEDNYVLSMGYVDSSSTCLCFSAAPQALVSVPGDGTNIFFSLGKASFVPEACQAVSGYTYNIDVHLCYKIFTSTLKWNDARASCQGDGAELAKFDTPQKEEFLKEIMRNDGSGSDLYIGGKLQGDVWRWLANGVPVNGFALLGGDVCLEIKPSLLFDDAHCDNNAQRYICEILIP